MELFSYFLPREIGECFNEIHEDSKCRAVVLSGAGRIFTAGESRIYGDYWAL
jgi:enoyl-CoA hydratase/carnithine racemase